MSSKHTTLVADEGSVSWGTMRDEDLIPSSMSVIRDLDPIRADELVSEWPDAERIGTPDDPESWYTEDDDYAMTNKRRERIGYFTSDLFDIMNEYAPPSTSFGSSEGDGADYGYWGWTDEEDDETEDESDDEAMS